jgi:hypothetical protein
MSFDLMVFDPQAAPSRREDFRAWYREQTRWGEPHSYFDPTFATPALHAWFMDMIATFPAMNGPFAVRDWPDDACITDYSIGHVVIYAAFAWSKAKPARDLTFRLAMKHRLGFYYVSSAEGEVFLPDGRGWLAKAFATASPDR